ncbi:hypothetical protein CEE39_09425 [bacterium (candidate division B38) B3_B38]|nr:MAG: hypothetical protein CEE39_09425 [bacterium (candidate division B38) B3_B38]
MKRLNIAMAGAATLLLISFILLGSPVNTYPFPERLETERAERGYLGVSIREISEDVLEAYGLKDRRGVLITNVVEKSPADKAGLREGDVITEFDGKPVDDTDDLTRFVRRCEPGSEVQVKIMRQGKAQTIKVTIGKLRRHLLMIRPGIRPLITPFRYPVIRRGIRPLITPFRFFLGGRLGLQLQDLNPSLGEYFQLKSGKGVLVLEVEEDSPAAEAGFLPGDVIISIDGEAVDDTENLHDILREAEEGDKLTFEILRKGKSQKLTVEMEDDDHIIIIGEPKVKKIIRIRRFPVEDYRLEIKMNKVHKVLERIQRRINCRLRKFDTDAMERATEQMERRLQQALETLERVTKKLGSTTARLHRLGCAL